MLFGNGWPVVGSMIVVENWPASSAGLGTLKYELNPRSMRVPS